VAVEVKEVWRITRMLVASGTVTINDLVTAAAGGVQTGADGGTLFGVALETGTAAAGDIINVMIKGTIIGDAASGVDFATGDHVYLAGSNEFDAGTVTNISAGLIAVQDGVPTDPATAGKIFVVIHSSAVNSLIHA